VIHGVDVSGWQGPGWTPEANDTFVFVKATEGRTYVSKDAEAQLKTAREAGLVVGHYHFLWPGRADEQAEFFLAHADIQPGDMLVCDWEDTNGGHPSVEDAAEFIKTVKQALPAHKVGLYCNASDWMNTSVKSGDFLWVAHYGVSKPGISTPWQFWQYSREPLDRNWGQFETPAELTAWVTGSGGGAVPATHHSSTWGVDYTAWDGEWVTVEDYAILRNLESEVRPWWGHIEIVQGGLSAGPKSANTHMGLGCFDVSVKDPSTGAYRGVATVLRVAGFFNRSGLLAFIRGYGLGRTLATDPFRTNRHLHVVSWESFDSLHPEAKAQLSEYQRWLDGEKDGDGLVGQHPYPGPLPPELEHWDTSPYNPQNIKGDVGTYYVDVAPDSVLFGLNVDRQKVRERERGYEIKAAKQINRWGRWNVVTATPTYYALEFLSATPLPPEGTPNDGTAT
jgi:Glycosyl hydrolases family 25